MWTLKSVAVRRKKPEELVDKEPLGHLTMLELSFVLSDGTDEISLKTMIENESVARRTIADQLSKLNGQDEMIEKIKTGTFTVEEPTPEPTVKELSAAELADKEREIDEEMARIEREEKLTAKAAENATLAAKLAERNALLAAKQ